MHFKQIAAILLRTSPHFEINDRQVAAEYGFLARNSLEEIRPVYEAGIRLMEQFQVFKTGGIKNLGTVLAPPETQRPDLHHPAPRRIQHRRTTTSLEQVAAMTLPDQQPPRSDSVSHPAFSRPNGLGSGLETPFGPMQGIGLRKTRSVENLALLAIQEEDEQDSTDKSSLSTSPAPITDPARLIVPRPKEKIPTPNERAAAGIIQYWESVISAPPPVIEALKKALTLADRLGERIDPVTWNVSKSQAALTVVVKVETLINHVVKTLESLAQEARFFVSPPTSRTDVDEEAGSGRSDDRATTIPWHDPSLPAKRKFWQKQFVRCQSAVYQELPAMIRGLESLRPKN